MEGLPVACYSTGTMNSVLEKLTKLKNNSNPADEFSVRTESLKEDLLGLKENFCDKVARRRATTHKQVEVCMKQVRELVFSIEDWIDQKPESNPVVDPAQKFDYFKAKIHGARERFTRYFDLHKLVPTGTDDAAPVKITINPRLLVEEKYCHGLFDGPGNELVKYLTDEKEEMRKVVSVVGREGIGKTTLAMEIYSELQHRRHLFQCQAFVSVGRRTPMRVILSDILRQVDPWIPSQQDVRGMITQLREYLCTKRYFILIDGIHSTWAWKVINCALPNNRGSRVLTTTCIIDVGRFCSCYPNDLVYQLEALNKENSRIFFLSKTITLQEEEKWDGFEEDFCCMLKMCGGIPLAIIVAAGLLLARKSEALPELKMVGESIYSLKQYSTSEWMTKILHMSYADLSLPLRSCFLYLSVFPEEYARNGITKQFLILLWLAEGFIPRIDEECSFVTGEGYFNELVSRRLIQPVFTFDNDEAVGCTIQGVILDFIRSLSKEENFATTAAELNSRPFPSDTIRRFSLNEDEADISSTDSVHLSSMRSLINMSRGFCPPAIGDFMNIYPFKLMRVLHIEYASKLSSHHLEGIGGLFLLRYLRLGGITRLPEDIGELERLETLILNNSGQPVTFPESIVKLQKLTHLLLNLDVAEIWEMPELEVASDICARSSSSLVKVAELLRKSQRLRVLVLTLTSASIPTETDLVLFAVEVVNSKLQSLTLCCHYGDHATSLLVDLWAQVTASLGKSFEPQRFVLQINGYDQYLLRSIPINIGSLASLTHMIIRVDVIKAQDFLVLGSLMTNLIFLNLSATDSPERGRLIIWQGLFPCLKVFSFKNECTWMGAMGLEFKVGAMQQLRRLRRTFVANKRWNQQYPDIGIEHLTCLTRVHAIIDCYRATSLEVQVAEATIRAQMFGIATKPALKLSRENGASYLPSYFVPRQVSEGTSIIRQFEDDDQIREDEGQHTIPVNSEKADKSTQGQTLKDKGKHSAPSKKEVFEISETIKVHQRKSSLFKKMWRQLIGLPKASQNSN